VADSTVAITAGSGTLLKSSLVDAGANQVQYVRELPADVAAAPGTWTLAVTASTIIASDAMRLGVMISNTGTARVFLRFDGTAATSAVGGYHTYLEPGDRWELPEWLCRLPVSVIAASVGGTLTYLLGTKA
jgi:hypothetical protein